MPISLRRLLVALTLCCALTAGATACGSGSDDAVSAASTPSATHSVDRQKLAKTRFVANAGLAAGATYQWIVKPWKAGKFKKGAHGRKLALVKAALAGGFAYNRLKAAHRNAEGDPTLSKALAPLTAGIDSLKELPSKLRKGDNPDGVAGDYNDIINKVKDAGKSAGAEVKDKVPSTSQLTSGS
ncbi:MULTISPECIES: hypothetical protein [Streptomyces]|uniref:Secreted protein n=1 Tax=Streptomyces doudnae TaxID=3075536 RepID=A0ABD5EL99_9ACTN|nr:MULTISPECIES: hypothetical protein [unclassified Streptomyces]MDT0435075.1 hypothetical protein [Streptomyces sp. DSM 41981]MYQ68250.1 hypothetical protein [Streptomyces sp. SID4950]SCE44413.1 hypothetical protein GA0115242_137933 [Streptomyces sp. SolWspMP-5a-2]